MLKIISLAALLAVSMAAGAQTPYLVRDINTTAAESVASSSPSSFFQYGSRVLIASNAGSSHELWITDGSAGGTTRLARFGTVVPSHFALLNGRVVFNGGDVYEELWVTDGTAAGTKLLVDIGVVASIPGDRVVNHGRMFFSANDDTHGRELWVTDGTAGGTSLVSDLTPGSSGSDPHLLTVMNDAVYFIAAGRVWRSDGTATGTTPLTDVINPVEMVSAGSQLFFTAAANVWVSDGTPGGTRKIVDLPASDSGNWTALTTDLVAFGAQAAFCHTELAPSRLVNALWITDGSVAGTRKVNDQVDVLGAYVGKMAAVGDSLFFAGTTPDTKGALWKSDGTSAGTVMLRDFRVDALAYFPSEFATVGNRIFFSAGDATGKHLWVTDGTAAGTTRVASADGSPTLGDGVSFVPAGDSVYFSGENQLNGFEPWKSDGTSAGTYMIANLVSDPAASSNPSRPVAAGDSLYFTAWDGARNATTTRAASSLWRTDGTAAGTLQVSASTTSAGATAIGASLFFIDASPGTAAQLWRSDGTPETTRPLPQLSLNKLLPSILFAAGDTVFASFQGYSELYSMSLSAAAPPVDLGVTDATGFADVAGRQMFFALAAYPDNAFSLMSTDGTAAGTRVVYPLIGFDGETSVLPDGRFLFSSAGKLWTSDGTYEGTTSFATVAGFTNATRAGRNVFFLSRGELWVTDGTAAGTRKLPAQTPGPPAAMGDRVVFSATDLPHGTEPWISDGTDAGTHLISDVVAGNRSSSPTAFAAADDAVYFAATDYPNAPQLWVTDGTAGGTRAVPMPEAGATLPASPWIARAGSFIYFPAATASTGTELWAIPLASTPQLTVDDVRVREGDSGTSTARFTVRLTPASTSAVTVNYATADATAHAGSDYDAVSGTLTFAPGETSKTIEVAVHGDSEDENDEAFLLTLTSASRIHIAKSYAFAIKADDDRAADLALSLDFSVPSFSHVSVNATNNGPRTITAVGLRETVTPDVSSQPDSCNPCKFALHGALPPNATRTLLGIGPVGQRYYTVTATPAGLLDPKPGDNSAAWTANGYLAMDALYLVPGQKAKVWFDPDGDPQPAVQVSDPSVLAAPATISVTGRSAAVPFEVTALAPGSTNLRVGTSQSLPFTINVVAPGTHVRWPLSPNMQAAATSFDKPVRVVMYYAGTVPFTGERPTGVAIASVAGVELQRVNVSPGSTTQSLTFYPPALGSLTVTLTYGGDSNFLPATMSSFIMVSPGAVSITGTLERQGSAGTLRVRVFGSPVAAPGGTLSVSEGGVTKVATLKPTTDPSTAEATFTFENFAAGTHTFDIAYAGDARYASSTQTIRVADPRHRGARH
jgi:ELWxxDGT repeat protein